LQIADLLGEKSKMAAQLETMRNALEESQARATRLQAETTANRSKTLEPLRLDLTDGGGNDAEMDAFYERQAESLLEQALAGTLDLMALRVE